MKPTVQKPLDGVTFLTLTDDRFTTARISVSLYVSLSEETAGVYAMLPYLLRRGCRRFDSVTAFSRELDRLYGASIDGDIAVSGETQIVQLSMSCLDDRFVLGGKAVSGDCADLLLDVLFDPPLENGVFRAQDVEEERRCTLESIAAEINDKRRYAVSRAKSLLCKGEPYAVSKYGTKEQVEALTAEELTAAWHRLLTTAPMRVMYQGSGDGKAVLDAFTARLAERETLALPPIVMNDAKSEVARENEKMDVNQCQLVLGFRTEVGDEHPLCDAMRVANAVFGATPHSLLFRHVREEHSLCYYCSSRYDRRKGVLVVESGVEQASLVKAEEEILRQLKALQNGEFSDEDLENAKLSQLDALLGAQDSASVTAEWYSAQGPDRLRTPEEVMDGIRAATREQIVEAANTIRLDCVFTLTPNGTEETA